jgi:HSP20 family protein
LVPPVDILERGNEVVFKMDLPGVSQNEIEVRVEENILIVQGERRFTKEALDESYLQIERPYGTFLRTFNLPRMIDHEGIKASYKDGVLRVVLPKRQEAQLKQVLVESK